MTFLRAKFIICMKYHVLMTWIWCKIVGIKFTSNYLRVKIRRKFHIDFVCLFCQNDNKKIFTLISYLIPVKMMRKICAWNSCVAHFAMYTMFFYLPVSVYWPGFCLSAGLTLSVYLFWYLKIFFTTQNLC